MAALLRVQRLEKRLHIINEILDTEEAYVDSLGTIVTLFLSPLRVNAILEKSSVDLIFSNIEEIRRVNVELLSSLRANRANPGKAFCRLAPFLKLYSLYAENFQRAVMVVQDCAHQNHEFAGFKASQEARSRCQSLTLEGFLIMPVQRIPRYRLLLEDLLRNTEEDHTDYKMVQEAHQQVCAVADHMNEFIRQHENCEKMLAIQNSLVSCGKYRIILPGRKFVKDGRLMKVCRKRPKERMLFLFSDQLVYAKPRGVLAGGHGRDGGTYSFCAALPLIVCGVTVLQHHPKVPGVDTLLMIECGPISLVLYSASAEEVVSWTKAVRGAIVALRDAHRSLITVHSQVNRRSVMLTNTLLKGTHLSANNEFDERHHEDTASQEEGALTYPLRFSIVCDSAGNDGDWKAGEEDDTKSPQEPSVPIDFNGSQDVDDILRALAVSESEMPVSPVPVQPPVRRQLRSSSIKSQDNQPRTPDAKAKTLDGRSKSADQLKQKKTAGERRRTGPPPRDMLQEERSRGSTLPSKNHQLAQDTRQKDSSATDGRTRHHSVAVPEGSLSNVKKRRREQRELLFHAETNSNEHIGRTCTPLLPGIRPVGTNKKLDEMEEHLRRQFPPTSNSAKRQHCTLPANSCSSSMNGLDQRAAKVIDDGTQSEQSLQSAKSEATLLLPGEPDETVAGDSGCTANCSAPARLKTTTYSFQTRRTSSRVCVIQ